MMDPVNPTLLTSSAASAEFSDSARLRPRPIRPPLGRKTKNPLLSMGSLVLALGILFLTAVSPAQDIPDTCYLFSYFTGNGEDGLHLAWSPDGYTFNVLNGGQSYLIPQVGENQLMRDPCLLLGPDGVFRMVWTTSWTGKTVGYASSTNLTDWSPQVAIPVWAGHPDEANVENTWAPEVVYDAVNQRYLIVWATTITGAFPETDFNGQNDNNHRQYATTTTNFVDFTTAELFFEPGHNVIDATFLEDDGQFRMFYKDETRYPTAHKYLQMASSTNVNGPYGNITPPITPDGRWSEGPTAVKIGADTIVYYDAYTSGFYAAARSTNLVDWEDISGLISFPSGAHHGTVIEVPGSVVSNLIPPPPNPSTNLAAIVYRWSFNRQAGSVPAGTLVPDSVSGAEAVVRGTNASFTGTALRLPGGTTGDTPASSIAGYVDLPNGLISDLANLTVEIWATPLSSQNWQRLFDFGRTVQAGDGSGAAGEWTGTPGTPAPGTTQASDNLMLSLNRGNSLDQQRCEMLLNGASVVTADSSLPTPEGVSHHYVCTFEEGAGAYGAAGGRLTWYRDGTLVALRDVGFHLRDIEDVNNWLGRSQWSADSNSHVEYDEVRIHSVALTAGDALGHYLAGPNAPVPPPTLKIRLAGDQVILAWPTNATARTLTYTASLDSEANWSVVTNSITISNADFQVALPVGGTSGFYRLEQ